MLSELSRKLLVVGLVGAGLYVIVVYGPDTRTSDEIAADERVDRLETALSLLTKPQVITEYAKAIAYAEECGYEFHDDAAKIAFRMAGLTIGETFVEGLYRDEVEDGLRTVALLTTGDDNRLVCEMAWSGYGPNGVALPGSVSKK